jgi:hypothetical protein
MRFFTGRRQDGKASWLAVLAALSLSGASCGTSAVGVNACKQIEEARCRHAPVCGVSLQPPYSTNGDDVDECIQFYDVACLHGLAVPDPGAAAVNACVAAIQSSACGAGSPLFETDPACDWLTQLPVVEADSEVPEADADAAPEADADAAAEADTEAGEGGNE